MGAGLQRKGGKTEGVGQGMRRRRCKVLPVKAQGVAWESAWFCHERHRVPPMRVQGFSGGEWFANEGAWFRHERRRVPLVRVQGFSGG